LGFPLAKAADNGSEASANFPNSRREYISVSWRLISIVPGFVQPRAGPLPHGRGSVKDHAEPRP
jgi:hypothetical protein